MLPCDIKQPGIRGPFSDQRQQVGTIGDMDLGVVDDDQPESGLTERISNAGLCMVPNPPRKPILPITALATDTIQIVERIKASETKRGFPFLDVVAATATQHRFNQPGLMRAQSMPR